MLDQTGVVTYYLVLSKLADWGYIYIYMYTHKEQREGKGIEFFKLVDN